MKRRIANFALILVLILTPVGAYASEGTSPDQEVDKLWQMFDYFFGPELSQDEQPEQAEPPRQPERTQERTREQTRVEEIRNPGTIPEFIDFVENLTQDLVRGIDCEEAQIRAIYDFIVLNFMYQDGRDGQTVDGSARPHPSEIPSIMTWERVAPDVPIFTVESGGFYRWPAYLEDSFVPTDMRNQNHILRAYRFLTTGEGVCNCFAALFNLMLSSLGFETRYVRGSYVNISGRVVQHAWSAVSIDGDWYFFDAQVEASNLTRLSTNRSNIPYHWFRQPVDGDLVAERYIWDMLAFGSFGLPMPAPPPAEDAAPVWRPVRSLPLPARSQAEPGVE